MLNKELTMEDLGTEVPEGEYLYAVVQTSVPFISHVTSSYSQARGLKWQNDWPSVVLAISPETLKKIQSGELTEIIL